MSAINSPEQSLKEVIEILQRPARTSGENRRVNKVYHRAIKYVSNETASQTVRFLAKQVVQLYEESKSHRVENFIPRKESRLSKLSDTEDPIGEHLLDEKEMKPLMLPLRDKDQKIISYMATIPGKATCNFTREEVEKLCIIYHCATLEILAETFPSFNRRELQILVKLFGATKENIMSPHVIEETPADEIPGYIIMAKRNGGMYAFRRNKTNVLQKALRDEFQRREEDGDILNRVGEIVENFDVKYRTKNRAGNLYPHTLTKTDVRTLFCAFSDIHFGKADVDIRGTETNKVTLEGRVMEIAQYLNSMNSEFDTAEVFILGDLLETPMFAGMHGEQFKRMDLFGSEQIMFAVEVLENFIASLIFKKVTLHFIGGNHDRFGKEREDDVERTGSKLIVSFLKKIFKGDNDVGITYYDEGIVAVTRENMNIVGFHGDNALVKKPALDIHQSFAPDKNKFTVILNGHYHSFKSEETGHFAKIQLGSVCSNDRFENYNLGHYNEPSFLIFNYFKNGFTFEKIGLL